ncbi:hypothetical protein [Xanthovirga aplysinae]|uniref:hypothetical protein n=1 Tax=Xanthovirga aplysinae TaxID=2529853 RepID=UPI0012BC5EAC|nr:hypothetical protein [Xanthovirga aplysinae]
MNRNPCLEGSIDRMFRRLFLFVYNSAPTSGLRFADVQDRLNITIEDNGATV